MRLMGVLLVVAWPSLASADEASVNRLSAILDYVASDYPGAVNQGQVIAAAEYQEQRGLLEEARSFLPSVGGSDAARSELSARVEKVIADFREKVPERELAGDCAVAQTTLFDDFGLAIGPVEPPSRERADELFAANCVQCHGADGRAQTEKARTLSPPPVSFFQADRMTRLSPRVVYQALTYGVVNTGMASFEVLPPADRWSLAFKVIGWRHVAPEAELAKGEAMFRAAGSPFVPTRTRLSELTDAEIEARLPPGDHGPILAWLRRVAAYAPESPTRSLIVRGEWEEARREIAPDGWLLRLKNGRVAAQLRQAIDAKSPGRVLHLLDALEESRSGLLVPWIAGALILAILALAIVRRARRSSPRSSGGSSPNRSPPAR